MINDQITYLVKAALAAVDPYNAIHNHLRLNGSNLVIGERIIDITNQDIRCIAVGKGSVPMARSIHTILGDRISKGLIVTKDNHLGDAQFPAHWAAIESAHPVPDDRSLAAGNRAWKLLANCTEQTLVLACISGGASSLMVAPHHWSVLIELLTSSPTTEFNQATQQLLQTAVVSESINLATVDPQANICLTALQAISSALLNSGLPIDQINAVRSKLDRLKGGRLVDRVGNGQVIGLILSDVIGDSISSIASGLTNHHHADNILVGNNRQACVAVAQAAYELGYNPQIITTELAGSARIRGMEIARAITTEPAKTILIYGGETTVNLPENCPGKGGRNQELGLAAAIELAQHAIPAWVVTLATDGTDGPTDAAGVRVNEQTVDRALALGLDPQAALDQHDAYPFFQRLGDLNLLGATGTNVADISIAIRPA